jgi:deoxyribodipyrimidine photo-lyase
LVDADLANNSLGWQWSAGCGADAAPYFRIFNPVRQAQRFDPEGVYIQRWLPELSGLSKRVLYAPWEASSSELFTVGIHLGKNYPRPIIDLQSSRQKALQRWDRVKRRANRGA